MRLSVLGFALPQTAEFAGQIPMPVAGLSERLDGSRNRVRQSFVLGLRDVRPEIFETKPEAAELGEILAVDQIGTGVLADLFKELQGETPQLLDRLVLDLLLPRLSGVPESGELILQIGSQAAHGG